MKPILLATDGSPYAAEATLEAIELEVEEADTAGHARAMIQSRLPDLVLLDVGLPDLDGLSFCRELKADSRTAEVPVVILTGADIGTSVAARAARAEGFLRKPFSPLELLAVAERLLGRLDRDGVAAIVRAMRPGDAADNPRHYRLATLFLVGGAGLWLVPQLFAIETTSQPFFAPMVGALTSTNHPDIAPSILFGSVIVVALTGAYIFNFVMGGAPQQPAKPSKPQMPEPVPAH